MVLLTRQARGGKPALIVARKESRAKTAPPAGVATRKTWGVVGRSVPTGPPRPMFRPLTRTLRDDGQRNGDGVQRALQAPRAGLGDGHLGQPAGPVGEGVFKKDQFVD